MPPSKRQEIIRATVELVAQYGFHRATSAKIAERAGVVEITIFRNFKTKERLFDEIYEELRSDLNAYISVGHDHSQPIRDRFFALCTRFCSYMETWPDKINFHEQFFHSSQGWRRRADILLETGAKFEDHPGLALLEEGRETGEIKNLPLTVLLGLVIGTLFNFERQQQFKKTRYSQNTQKQVIQACWDGMSKK